jgi:type II secretory pathway pseudopilin PulG
MMIIVVIVGVLGTLATYGVLKYVRTARTSEALGLVNDIKIAQEMYRDEKLTYLDGGGYDSWHPDGAPGAFKMDWHTSTSGEATTAMQTLAVMPSGPVYFRYTVVAGDSGAVPSPNSFLAQPLNLPANSTGPFYIVVARGDLDGDGETFSHVVGHSFDAAIRVDREGE